MVDVKSPAELMLGAELESARFLVGVDQGRWTLQQYAFPHVYVRVSATCGEAKFEQDFHLICDGYPNPGPFAERWAFAEDKRPAPPSGEGYSPAFQDAMKDWTDGGQHGGIYRAWQRRAANHGSWAALRPDEAWGGQRDLAFIMERLFDVVAEQVAFLDRRATA